MYLLDTNVVIVFLQGRNQALRKIFSSVSVENKNLCSIVAGELYFGVEKSQQPQASLSKVNALLTYLPVLPYDMDAARHYGEIRAYLNRQGTPIGPYDLQIAAIARSRGLILVTHNTREFARVPELQLEDWEI